MPRAACTSRRGSLNTSGAARLGHPPIGPGLILPGRGTAPGIDWAQKRDSTVAAVVRCETTPLQLVAVYRAQRRPWLSMTAQVGSLLDAFPGPAAHDATGAGNAMGTFPALAAHDQLQGVTLVGRVRTDLFRHDIGAIERHEIVGPRIDACYTEHLYCGEDDLFGNGHPPETVRRPGVGLSRLHDGPAAQRRDTGRRAGRRDTMTPAKRPSTRARQTPIQSLDDLQPDPPQRQPRDGSRPRGPAAQSTHVRRGPLHRDRQAGAHSGGAQDRGNRPSTWGSRSRWCPPPAKNSLWCSGWIWMRGPTPVPRNWR